MKIRTVTLSRTYNLGDYESKRVEVTAEVDEDDKPEDVRAGLRTAVDYFAEPAQ